MENLLASKCIGEDGMNIFCVEKYVLYRHWTYAGIFLVFRMKLRANDYCYELSKSAELDVSVESFESATAIIKSNLIEILGFVCFSPSFGNDNNREEEKNDVCARTTYHTSQSIL